MTLSIEMADGGERANPSPRNANPRQLPFSNYVEDLRRFAAHVGRNGLSSAGHKRVAAELDGNASQSYRRNVSLKTRQDLGTFFTTPRLADRLIDPHAVALAAGASIMDPACGLGDLLLAAARHLPITGSLGQTLEAWGGQLRGHDLRADFVATTQARLYLLALARGATPTPQVPLPEEAFPHITQANLLSLPDVLKAIDVAVLKEVR